MFIIGVLFNLYHTYPAFFSHTDKCNCTFEDITQFVIQTTIRMDLNILNRVVFMICNGEKLAEDVKIKFRNTTIDISTQY